MALLPLALPTSSAVCMPDVFLFLLCPFSCPKPPMSVGISRKVSARLRSFAEDREAGQGEREGEREGGQNAPTGVEPPCNMATASLMTLVPLREP